MSRPVFGVDRVPDPWQPTWEDGSLFTSDELRELEAAEEEADRAREAIMPDRDLFHDPLELRGTSGVVVATKDRAGWHRRQNIPRGALDGINEGSL